MKIKMMIRTPKGEAKKAEIKIKPVILGLHTFQHFESYTSPEDDTIIWEIEDKNVRKILKVTNNCNRFDYIMKNIMTNKKFNKHALGKLNAEEKAALEDMLLNQTKIEIVKEATAQEMVEGTESYWQKLKRIFKRNKNEE